MRELRIEYVPIQDLRLPERNAREHPKKQIHQVAAAFNEFGIIIPLVVDQNGVIYAGVARYLASLQLNLPTVPVIRVEHLSQEQKRAYALADNKIAANAGFDLDVLAIELRELAAQNLSFDLEVTGFDTAEIDLLVDGPSSAKPDPADVIPELQEAAVTRTGDMWILDGHRLLCADSLEARTYSELMERDKARVVFADVPYNVKIDGHVGGLGAIKHREFAMASGEMSEAEFTQFLETSFRHAANVSVDGAIHFICIDWRHVGEVLAASKPVYSELKNICVWNKDNGGMGSFYRSKHELVFVFKVVPGLRWCSAQMALTSPEVTMNAARKRAVLPARDVSMAVATNPAQHHALSKRIAALNELTALQLRDEWRRLYRAQPPRLSRDLLIRTLAYRIQELAYGGLSKATHRKLSVLTKELEGKGSIEITPASRLRSGVRLVREWRGKTHTVVVMEAGFEYAGTTYSSLTKIAQMITGAHWSGPRFFGLIRKPAIASADHDSTNRHAGRGHTNG